MTSAAKNALPVAIAILIVVSLLIGLFTSRLGDRLIEKIDGEALMLLVLDITVYATGAIIICLGMRVTEFEISLGCFIIGGGLLIGATPDLIGNLKEVRK